MNELMNTWPMALLAVYFAVFFGQIIMSLTIPKVRKIAGIKKEKEALVIILGIFERCLYVILLLISRPEGIYGWLAIKVLTRWHQIGQKGVLYSNVYLIGNILQILISLLSVFIAMMIIHYLATF